MEEMYVLSHDVIFYHCFMWYMLYIVKGKPESKKCRRGKNQEGVTPRTLELLISDKYLWDGVIGQRGGPIGVLEETIYNHMCENMLWNMWRGIV